MSINNEYGRVFYAADEKQSQVIIETDTVALQMLALNQIIRTSQIIDIILGKKISKGIKSPINFNTLLIGGREVNIYRPVICGNEGIIFGLEDDGSSLNSCVPISTETDLTRGKVNLIVIGDDSKYIYGEDVCFNDEEKVTELRKLIK